MVNVNITGGVSPLKRQRSRGGKFAGKATATGRRRGGFAKSAGKRGAGGRNVGGYNVRTRFTPAAAFAPPPSGGTTTIQKPVTIEDGEPIINLPDGGKPSKKYIPGTDPSEKREEVEKEGVSNFKKACYDDPVKLTGFRRGQVVDGIKCEYSDDPNYKDTYTKVTKIPGTDGRWIYYDENGNEITEAKYNALLKKSSPNKMKKSSPGKMKLGGYRAMHGTSK